MKIGKIFYGLAFAYCAASVIMLCGPSRADDTDIYLTPPTAPDNEPLVMFSLEWNPDLNSTWCNAGNCAQDVIDLHDAGFLDLDPAVNAIKRFHILRAVLKKVLTEVGSGVKIGLMTTHDHANVNKCGTATGCTNGGFIAFGFRSLSDPDTLAEFDDLFGRMLQRQPTGSLTHTYQASEMFFEFFRYLTGGRIHNGHNGKTSFDITGTGGNPGHGNNSINLNDEFAAYQTDSTTGHPFMWDDEVGVVENAAHNRYISPYLTSSECTKAFTVNFTRNGNLNQDGDSDSQIKANFASGGMGLSNLSNSSNQRFREVLARLKTLDLADTVLGTPNLAGEQTVKSYFIAETVNNTVNGFAEAGGTDVGLQLSDNIQDLVDTLQGILNEILSVSTTFVAASVPVNVFNRSEVLDNVYLALFQPMENPRWPGNVKKLKLATDDTDVFLVDANNERAVGLGGRIAFNALTYWTKKDSLPFPDPNITGQEADQLIDKKDGRFVPRGGAGQNIAGISGSGIAVPGLLNSETGARQLYTEPTSGTTLVPLNANSSTAASLEPEMDLPTTDSSGNPIALTTRQAQAFCLLKYARGYNANNINSCASPGVRTWMFGDPLHSQPLPINYGGTVDNPDIRILLGGNDGFFRMIRNTLSNGAESGKEIWAFMPRSVMPILKKLAENNPDARHPYGVDGAPAVYMVDENRNGTIDGNDKVWVFVGLRRGGNAYYALDVSNPDAPRFMWSIVNDPASPDPNFGLLGLTFSRPRVITLDWGAGKKPALIFGGGYDTNKDYNSASSANVVGTDDDIGTAIYIVDAETGALVWKAVQSGLDSCAADVCVEVSDMLDSIPSELSVMDADGNGVHDRAYVGDTGGKVWRVDFAGNNRAAWRVTAVLSVGRHSTDCQAAADSVLCDRRFFHKPDIALSSDGSGNFDAVIIGSGDRANPLDLPEGRLVLSDPDAAAAATRPVNEFYLYKDRQTASGGRLNLNALPFEDSELADLTTNCIQESAVACDSSIDLLGNGWKIRLTATGEKSLAAPLTLGGSIFFTTYRPPVDPAGSCGPPEGNGAFYAVNLQSAGAVFNRHKNESEEESGQDVFTAADRAVVLESGGIPAEVVAIPTSDFNISGVPILRPDLNAEITAAKLFWKTFWYQDNN